MQCRGEDLDLEYPESISPDGKTWLISPQNGRRNAMPDQSIHKKLTMRISSPDQSISFKRQIESWIFLPLQLIERGLPELFYLIVVKYQSAQELSFFDPVLKKRVLKEGKKFSTMLNSIFILMRYGFNFGNILGDAQIYYPLFFLNISWHIFRDGKCFLTQIP